MNMQIRQALPWIGGATGAIVSLPVAAGAITSVATLVGGGSPEQAIEAGKIMATNLYAVGGMAVAATGALAGLVGGGIYAGTQAANALSQRLG